MRLKQKTITFTGNVVYQEIKYWWVATQYLNDDYLGLLLLAVDYVSIYGAQSQLTGLFGEGEIITVLHLSLIPI